MDIGFTDDDLFGCSSLHIRGNRQPPAGGDEYTISGSTGSSTVRVGDGENSITMGGAGNIVSVWGGDNWIVAGTGSVGNQHVTILGVDGTDTATPIDPNDSEDGSVPLQARQTT